MKPAISVYQVWQWTTWASRLSFAMARLRPKASIAPANRGSVFSFAPGPGVVAPDRQVALLGILLSEAAHLDLHAAGELPAEILDVYPGPAVHVRWILVREQGHLPEVRHSILPPAMAFVLFVEHRPHGTQHTRYHHTVPAGEATLVDISGQCSLMPNASGRAGGSSPAARCGYVDAGGRTPPLRVGPWPSRRAAGHRAPIYPDGARRGTGHCAERPADSATGELPATKGHGLPHLRKPMSCGCLCQNSDSGGGD